MKGKLIAIEAGDASGKATQTRLLYEALRDMHPERVQTFSFPRYASESSYFIRKYLSGGFGDLSEVSAQQASMFYAMDRYASYKTEWEKFYQDGGIVIMDRYVPSNIVHQAAKLMKDETQEELSDEQKSFCDFIENLEYRIMNIPAPDAVIFLDMNPNISISLLEKRAKEENREKDIHEKDTGYLKKVHKCYQLFAKYKEWYRIRCNDSIGNVFPPEEIHAWVLALSKNVIEQEFYR